MFCVPSAPAGPGGLIVPWPDTLNTGGTPATDVTAMWSVRKWLTVRPTVSAPLVCSPVPGDVNDGGSRSGVLIGVGATLVVIGVLLCCGMMWNQPSVTTLLPALCACAASGATAAAPAAAQRRVFFITAFPSAYWTNAPIVKYGVDPALSRKPNTPPVKMNLPVGDVLPEPVWIVVTVPGTFCV